MKLSKMYLNKTIYFIIIGFLSGCDTNIITEVNFSDILNDENMNLKSQMYVEVDECSVDKVFNKPSETIIKLKRIIPNIFSDAKYMKCVTKEFSSYAYFSLPIVIRKGNEKISKKYINLIKTKEELLAIFIPASINYQIKKFNEEDFNMEVINMNMNIRLLNDTTKNISLRVMSSFINDEPYVYENFVFQMGGHYDIKLSDVSMRSALENKKVSILFQP